MDSWWMAEQVSVMNAEISKTLLEAKNNAERAVAILQGYGYKGALSLETDPQYIFYGGLLQDLAIAEEVVLVVKSEWHSTAVPPENAEALQRTIQNIRYAKLCVAVNNATQGLQLQYDCFNFDLPIPRCHSSGALSHTVVLTVPCAGN